MQLAMFAAIAFIIIYVVVYRQNNGQSVYKYIAKEASAAYDKYAPYSYKSVREKVKELGQEYTTRQYLTQIAIFSVSAFAITYLYFYNLAISLLYSIASLLAIPYLTYLRCHRIYSEFIFEQIQVYTTNVIMEFATTQSFVKALEGVYESNILEDPVKADVKAMIDMSYTNGTIDEALNYMNSKYDFFIVRNMHQLFLQITNEGAKNTAGSLENMSQDIDMLVENVYRDRMDRAAFHKKFLQFGIVLYLLVMLTQFLLGVENYIKLLENPLSQFILHAIVWINTYFLLNGEKYYNENVGAE